jgi:hypothetical protein
MLLAHAKHAYSALVNFSLSLYLYLCFTLTANFAEFDADFESVKERVAKNLNKPFCNFSRTGIKNSVFFTIILALN